MAHLRQRLPSLPRPDLVIGRGAETGIGDDFALALVDHAVVRDKRHAVPDLHGLGDVLDRHVALVRQDQLPLGDAVDLRLVPALGEDLAVREDADLAIVKILQQLLALVLRERPVNDGRRDVLGVERLGQLRGVLDVDAERDAVLTVVRVIDVGGARYSRRSGTEIWDEYLAKSLCSLQLLKTPKKGADSCQSESDRFRNAFLILESGISPF